jgi:hypothetical protein
MSLQARMSEGDKRLYDANRDVAHNFPAVIREVFHRIQHRRWEALDALLEARKVSDIELGAAVDVLAKFVSGAVDNPKEDMQDVLKRVGWFDLSDEAHVAVMATVGTVMLGIFFHGAREATLGGEGPCSNLDELVARGREAHLLMTTPRWRRPLARIWHRYRKAYYVLRSSKASDR